MNEDKQKQMRNLAKQAKRQLSLQKRKEVVTKLPEAPILLTLNQLSEKTGLSFSTLRKMIVEEKQIPYIKVGNVYRINYELFLKYITMEG